MPDKLEGSIVVAGGTGRIGGATLRSLQAMGVPFTALLRSAERRDALPDPGTPALVSDFADPDGVAAALAGAERLLLCSSHGPAMREHQLGAVEAAVRAGVRRIVKISASPASIFPGTTAKAAAAHLAVEDALRDSAIEHVAIRPNAFAQVLLGLRPAIDAGTFALPLADARVSWVDAEDVGRVAAALLAADELGAEDIVEVTGPDGLTMDEACAAIGRVVGREVVYRPVSEDDARKALVARGVDPWYVDHMLGVFGLFRDRDAGRASDAVERLTGRPAVSFAEVARRVLAEPGVTAIEI